MTRFDATVVGAGPNGLAAAVALGRAGKRVLVLEAQDRIGGGLSSAELTLPGFIHDVGSAVHPFGVASPFFRQLPLERFGLRWVEPPTPLAHPLDTGTVTLERSIDATARQFGPDARAYDLLMRPIVQRWEQIVPLLGPIRLPRHPIAAGLFGMRALWPITLLAKAIFRTPAARALLAGICAHSCLPLERMPSAAFGLVLGAMGHRVGWPIPAGGAQAFANALAAMVRAMGGEIRTGERVDDLSALPRTGPILLDVAPPQVLALAGAQLPDLYAAQLRQYRYGPGVFKVDWALDGPVPWRDAACTRAGTLHLCGTMEEMAASERAPWQGRAPERPYVLFAQPSLFDPSRAPAGKHTAWAYCHVPHGSTEDMTDRIEAQVERFAPGFRDRILARHTAGPAALQRANPTIIGGDITGGVPDLFQLFTRPNLSLTPYRTPVPGVYLCSSSTPPGAGIHGLCGYYAAATALSDERR